MILGGAGVYAASDGAGRVSAFGPPAVKPPTWSTGPTYLHSEPLSRPAELGFAVVHRTRPVASRSSCLFFGFARPVGPADLAWAGARGRWARRDLNPRP